MVSQAVHASGGKLRRRCLIVCAGTLLLLSSGITVADLSNALSLGFAFKVL